MEERKKRLYDYCADEEQIFSFVWRGAFLAKICNISIPDDVTVKVITEDEKESISSEPYSDAFAHLLIMYGAGYISLENLKDITRDAPKYKDEIYAAENFVIAQSGKDEKERVSEDIIQKILFCTINSKKYPQIQPIGFEMARKLCESTHTTIRNGFVFVKDVDFLTQLLNADEHMGYFKNDKLEIIDKDQVIRDLKEVNSIEDILNPKNDKTQKDEGTKADPESSDDEIPDMPFIINLNNTYYIQQIYDKPYAIEFIHYAKAEGIPFDENFEKEYTEYIRRNKRRFTISAISRKREICGNEVNWFDYGTTKYADKKIVIGDSFDITEQLDLTEFIADDVDMSDEELVDFAVNKFLEGKKLPDETVIEITFCGKKLLYLYKDNGRIPLDSEKFRRIPFDYNNVWTTVMEWSRSKLIQKKGDRIVVPESEMQKLEQKDREYAKRMIEEQYSLKKGGNKMLQKLSELKSYAKKQMDIKEQQEALKSERDPGIQEDKKE